MKNIPRTATILIAAGLLLVLFVTFSLLEYARTRSDFISMIRDEGFTLLDVLTASGERSLLAYEESERLMQARLFDNARWIEANDYERTLPDSSLRHLAEETALSRILLFDARGGCHADIHDGEGADTSGIFRLRQTVVLFLADSETDSLAIGFDESGTSLKQRYAVMVRRRRGGAVVVVSDAGRLADFRKELGPGRLIQEIGEQPGIAYVALQDTVGILMASTGVTSLSRIQSDPFLGGLYARNTQDGRFHPWLNGDVYEIAGDFLVEGDNIGLFRIGLDLSQYRRLLRNTRYRLTVIVLLYVLAGAAGIVLLISRQNLRLMSRAYRRVTTHTDEILQKMRDGIIAVDSRAAISVCNEAACAMLGLDPEITGRGETADLNPAVRAVLLESLSTGSPVLRGGEPMEIQGKERILSLRTSVLKNEEGAIDTVILVITDLTDQKALERELRQQEKLSAMGKLAAGVAHEIRNPINAISMIAQRFLREFTPVKDREEYFSLAQTIVSESRRSNEIIRRFLEFARPPELSIEPVSTHTLISEIRSIMQSTAESGDITLKTDAVAEAILEIDGGQMKQVFINLLQNSFQAVPPGGTVEISGALSDDAYRFTVSDTGPGIADENIDAIFDLYFSTRADGLGMGLAIVHQIISRHRGSIVVGNRESGGAEFTITLPRRNHHG
ncbi:PAS domain-containing protein [bacterium]|nr:PAS domain-containing protein [bacterium]